MKKVLKWLLIIACIALCFILGYEIGKNHVIKNQIVTNKKHDIGTYEIIIDNQMHEYYFE